MQSCDLAMEVMLKSALVASLCPFNGKFSCQLSLLPVPVTFPFLLSFCSHSLLCHSVFKDAASLGESLIQAPALAPGSLSVLLPTVPTSSGGVEAKHVL